eukprot:CAMPEP_0173388418 /NCGR_PEP_ID=MMETSP1356-20130122/10732_1 /TAXON_ID=77927 ORGANISM="Hemiselmis virescens, Strain PCC157" /NCGR_SAMPLE_ID=MMETSP1356 /ASSEMBLY_ACC=CAM_ASM_000847 /LENGTH=106 /DNA_ID=CAMNT_0014345319 /DNA_START=258 /DNA_END=575 /DNA_ORIENTATION=+
MTRSLALSIAIALSLAAACLGAPGLAFTHPLRASSEHAAGATGMMASMGSSGRSPTTSQVLSSGLEEAGGEAARPGQAARDGLQLGGRSSVGYWIPVSARPAASAE